MQAQFTHKGRISITLNNWGMWKNFHQYQYFWAMADMLPNQCVFVCLFLICVYERRDGELEIQDYYLYANMHALHIFKKVSLNKMKLNGAVNY